MIIQKAKETMSSRQRVLNTFAYEKTDRVTIGFDTNPLIKQKFFAALGVSNEDNDAFLHAIGVDYHGIGASYTGPLLYPEKPGLQVGLLDGSYSRYVKHDTGGYWENCEFPLMGASDEMLDSFPVPDPDDFNYDEALDNAKSLEGEFALFAGGAGTPGSINSNGRIMGMEDIFCHLYTENEAALRFIKRRADFKLGHLERLLDKCRGYIDFVWLGEDLGSQHAPMISLEMYRKLIKPIHKDFIDLAKSYGLYTLFHTCGCSSFVYEDFIEMGVTGVDALQPEAANMSPAYLSEHFGGRLNFRGCISTAGALSFGTPDDVRKVCMETLEIMKKHRGYHFAPSHMIQDNTPVENVIAMYRAAHEFGCY